MVRYPGQATGKTADEYVKYRIPYFFFNSFLSLSIILNKMADLIRKSNPELIIEILKDPDRKSLPRITYELIILFLRYRELPAHYFSRYIFKKQTRNFKDFLPNKFAGKISVLINDHKSKEVLDNKLFFNFFYGQFDIRLPKIILYNHKNMFIIGNQTIEVNNDKDFTILLDRVFKDNPSHDSLLIKKTNASSSGKKIFKLFRAELRVESEYVKEIYSDVVQSGFLFQETIKQHPALDKMNPSCLNTIRIDTYINPDGKIDIGSAYLRMSICESHIDNISSGGCQVGIDLQTGKLKKYGYSLIQTVGVKVMTEHPITGTVFEDFSLPYFSRIKELAIKTARLMPGLRLIGWDVAIGESDPILIEGNSDYDLSGNDIADEGYMANKVFRKVLNEIGYL